MTWSWPAALLGGVCALPAGVIALNDPQHGLAFAIGVLPAALVGVLPRRRARVALVALGAMIGAAVLLGGVLAGAPVIAVAALVVLGVAAAWLGRRSRLGQIAMTLALPMVAIGFSFDDVSEAAGLAALMVAGSAVAWLVSLPWPQRPLPPVSAPGAPGGEPRQAMPTLGYGVRLGAAGATAAAIGFLLDFDHVGWACAAALLVMRPAAEMQRLRSVGRILAVLVGALLAIGFVRLDPADGWYALAAIAAVAGAAGTHRSRWYLTPAFTTFIVFLLLLYAEPQDAGARLGERVGETLLGVGLAYLFGLALPALALRTRQRRPSREH
ncbi:FUSC family protein [Conexibacter sp. CPCC 206217]|uniref:FUSC family protein n=1 Tax=Conexibacter sp. CPCC 206217 TaxID=3064574 RepID=UPI002722CA34|nr:FUSC family protein [Conexibacter sp. CPCC 206217]MDO8208855.1 FUSC family protein [Conexibacter sp. CPCC 206217]